MTPKFEDRIDENEYLFGDSINPKDYSEAQKSVSFISYKYIDFENTDYHFFQDCFDNNDIRHYFDFMNILSSDSFIALLNNKKRDWHLNPNDYNRDTRFRQLVNKALGIEKPLPPNCQPSFYHFALYTNSTDTASRATKIKSPRIYFFIGNDAVIYPLFYDPYHEINPL